MVCQLGVQVLHGAHPLLYLPDQFLRLGENSWVFLLFCPRWREDPKWPWEKLSLNILSFVFLKVIKAGFYQKMRKFRNHCAVIWWQKLCREALQSCCRVCAVFPSMAGLGIQISGYVGPQCLVPCPYSLFSLLQSSDSAEPGWSRPGAGAGAGQAVCIKLCLSTGKSVLPDTE